MTRAREVRRNESIADIPVAPSHRHPMSLEPVWDTEAVRKVMELVRQATVIECGTEPSPALSFTVQQAKDGSWSFSGFVDDLHVVTRGSYETEDDAREAAIDRGYGRPCPE